MRLRFKLRPLLAVDLLIQLRDDSAVPFIFIFSRFANGESKSAIQSRVDFNVLVLLIHIICLYEDYKNKPRYKHIYSIYIPKLNKFHFAMDV